VVLRVAEVPKLKGEAEVPTAAKSEVVDTSKPGGGVTVTPELSSPLPVTVKLAESEAVPYGVAVRANNDPVLVARVPEAAVTVKDWVAVVEL
jgi:hypothetical protein